MIGIDVSTHPEASGQFPVAEGGTITIQGLGPVQAAGRTADELADDLSRRFSLIDRQIPRVKVTLVQSRSQEVAVLGAVMLPGLYKLPENGTAWSAIELAGGATDDADLASVEVLPGETGAGRSTVTVNVAAAIQGGTLEKLDKLRPGDTVRVPRKGAAVSGAAGAVFVFGAIGSQGAVPVDQAPDLLALVARAGGPGPDADLRHVEIVRRDGTRYSHLRVDLRQYLRSSNPAGTVALHPGDTVYLPRREPRNYLYDVLRIVSPVLALTASIIALSRR